MISKENPFVIYCFKILTGEYAGWFYIGQSHCFTRIKSHKSQKAGSPLELTAALGGIEGVDWSVEFLEKSTKRLGIPEIQRLETYWISTYIERGEKLLNHNIPKEALKLLFTRAARPPTENLYQK